MPRRPRNRQIPAANTGHVQAGGAESPAAPRARSVEKHHQASPDVVQDKSKCVYNSCDATATQAGERERSRRRKTCKEEQTQSPDPGCCLVPQSCPTPVQPHGQAPLSTGLSRQEYWSGLPFSPPGDLPVPGIEPVSPALAGRFFTTEPPSKPLPIPGPNHNAPSAS